MMAFPQIPYLGLDCWGSFAPNSVHGFILKAWIIFKLSKGFLVIQFVRRKVWNARQTLNFVCACSPMLRQCLTFCNPKDCSPPDFSLYGISQARQTLNFVCACSPMLRQCLTFCNLKDCSPPDFSLCGISQARTLEWVTTSSSRGSSQPRDQTCVSYIGKWILYHWAT